MRMLFIGELEKAKIAQALAMARAKPVLWEKVRAIALSEEDLPGGKVLRTADRMPGFKPQGFEVLIPNGYRVMVSYEEQPAGMFLHVSISVRSDVPETCPSIEAARMIWKEFGIFGNPDKIWLEEYEKDKLAVNAIKLVSEAAAGHG